MDSFSRFQTSQDFANGPVLHPLPRKVFVDKTIQEFISIISLQVYLFDITKCRINFHN